MASSSSAGWRPFNGFNTPFSLNVQVQWFQRYVLRIETYYYYKNTYGNAAVVAQALPAETSLNQSLYVVYAGFHDYFFDLFEKKATPTQGVDSAPDMVAAITTAIKSRTAHSLVTAHAQEILVVNLPPLGCIPALLTLYTAASADEYDPNGYLKKTNLITDTHNRLLEAEIIKLRAQYPEIYLYYGNAHGAYSDILREPSKYNVTEPLKAACGYGGKYNFNKKVRCGQVGKVNGKLVNLTTISHALAKEYLSFDGIHLSNTANKGITKAFFGGKHITSPFNCLPDYSRFDGRS